MATIKDPTAPILRRLLTKHELGNVRLLVNSHGAHAYAHPTSFHPKVKERRDAALAALAERYPDGAPFSEASKLTEGTLEPVAHGRGETVMAALADLEIRLKAGLQ